MFRQKYIEKMKHIENKGKFKKYSSLDELRVEIEK